MFSEDKLDEGIDVELDRLNIDAGETVTGRLIVTLKKPRKCTVRVKMGWRTTGKGNTAADTIAGQDLFAGDLEAGVYSFPFELKTPNGPFSYQGVNMDLEWFVEGQADIPWKIDPKSSAVFKLTPSSVATSLAYTPGMHNATGQIHDVTDVDTTLGIIGLAILFGGLWIAFQEIIPGVLVMAVGATLSAAGWRPVIAKKRLEDVKLSFHPAEIHAGMLLNWKVSYTPSPKASINHAEIIFLCTETVTSGSGKHRTTRQEVLHRWEADLPAARGPNFEGTFEVPHFFSFSLNSHEVRWTVTLNIDIAGWPDFNTDTQFVVLPPVKQLTSKQHIAEIVEEPSSTVDGIW